MTTIYLVACVKTKKKGMHKAKDLYCSPWFKKARNYVEKTMKQGDKWFILSAKHHLLPPDRKVSLYNKTLGQSGSRKWADEVLKQIQKHISGGERIVVFAGDNYRKYIIEPLKILARNVKVPLEGKGFGKQLHWFNLKLKPCRDRT